MKEASQYKKRIVFIVHSFDKINLGGVLKVVTDLSNELSSKYEVTVCSLGKVNDMAFLLNESVCLDELGQVFFDTRQLKGVLKVKWFRDSYRTLRSYIKDCSDGTYFISTSPPLSLLFAFLKNKKHTFIACDHTSITYKLPFGLQSIRLSLLRKLDYYVALTPKDNEYFRRNGVNSICIPNFIYKNETVNSNGNSIVYIGRFSEEKNPLAVVNNFYESKLCTQDVYLEMYGYGDLQNDIERIICKNGLEDFVKIFNNESNIIKMLRNAKCLVLTSNIEGFGLVLLEAMSLGVPCISYDAKYGPRYIIKDNVNGFLVKNEEEFVFRLRQIFNNEIIFDKELVKESISEFYSNNVLNKWYSIIG